MIITDLERGMLNKTLDNWAVRTTLVSDGVRFLSETNKRREAWLGAMVWVGFLGILTYGVFH